MKMRFAILILVILAAIGFLIWIYKKGQQPKNVIFASGTIETTEIQVGSRVGGRVDKVDVEEGQNMVPGQNMVQFAPYQLPAQRKQLVSQLNESQAKLDELINGPRPQEIASAHAQYLQDQYQTELLQEGFRVEEIAQAVAARRQAQSDFENAERNYQRFKELLSTHVVSQQEFDNVQTTYLVDKDKLSQALQKELELKRGNRPLEIMSSQEKARSQLEQWKLLESGSRPEEIAAQKALVQSITEQIQQVDKSIAELVVHAPCHCEVSSMDLRPGQLILPDQTLATLINFDDLWVRVYIPEENFGEVHTGDIAEVHVDPYPHKTFEGKVIQVASQAEFTPRNVQTQETRKVLVFGIKVQLNNKDRLLRPGMPVDVTFTHLHRPSQ